VKQGASGDGPCYFLIFEFRSWLAEKMAEKQEMKKKGSL